MGSSDSTYDDTAEEYGYPAAAAQKDFGLDPAIQRSNLLPYYSKATGWVAPQALYQAVKGLLAPGEAMKGHQPSMEDAITTAQMIGTGGLGGSAALPGSVPRGALGMTVYHGTHHTFPGTEANPLGEFSLAKLGTGQGAQVFGHGIYTSESPDVAKMYRRGAPPTVVTDRGSFSTANPGVVNWKQDPRTFANHAVHMVAAGSGSSPGIDMLGPAQRILTRLYENKYNEVSPTVYRDAQKIIKKWQNDNGVLQPGGHLYHADVPDPKLTDMMDWDRPVSAQPKKVQAAFLRAYSTLDDKSHLRGAMFPETGEDIYNFLGQLNAKDYPRQDEFASRYLSKEGVPGVRYLDGFSRIGRDRQSSNFVLFDPSIATITKREAHGGLVKGNGGIMQALRGYAEGGLVDGDSSWLGRAAQGAWQGATADAGPAEQVDIRGQPSTRDAIEAAWPAIKQTAQHPIGALAALAHWAKNNPDKVGALLGGMVNPTAGPTQAGSPIAKVLGDAEYVYHATNTDRLSDIIDSGKLKTFGPSHGTEQGVWPDGSTQKRAYFNPTQDTVNAFAPAEGTPVVIRTKVGPHIKKEPHTGDVYTTRPIKAGALEYLGPDKQWHPVGKSHGGLVKGDGAIMRALGQAK